MWYHDVVGEGRCAVVDTWWQTETGGILITPLPGAIPTKPGSATLPFFGVEPVLVDEGGRMLEGNGVNGQPLHPAQLARAGAHPLRRPRPLPRDLLRALSRALLHRRRLPARPGRLLLDHRPGRRRAQRLRAPAGHRRGGERAGRAPGGGRGGGGRVPARDQGPGHLRLRASSSRSTRASSPASWSSILQRPGAPGDRRVRHARPHPDRRRPAQDALGQDHAPHPAQDRRRGVRRSWATSRPWPTRGWWSSWSRTTGAKRSPDAARSGHRRRAPGRLRARRPARGAPLADRRDRGAGGAGGGQHRGRGDGAPGGPLLRAALRVPAPARAVAGLGADRRPARHRGDQRARHRGRLAHPGDHARWPRAGGGGRGLGPRHRPRGAQGAGRQPAGGAARAQRRSS